MILLTDVLIAFIAAFFFTLAIAFIFGRPATLGTYIMLFILMMLAILAGANWIVPIGIPVAGYYWATYLFVGLIVSLLFLALLPGLRPPRNLSEARRQERREAATILTFDFFFVLLVLILALVIVIGYV